LWNNASAVGEFLLSRIDRPTVSDFAAAEVAVALSRLVRMGRLTRTEAAERLADFDAWSTGETDFADIDSHDCRLANT
jgi:uncharacterized protein